MDERTPHKLLPTRPTRAHSSFELAISYLVSVNRLPTINQIGCLWARHSINGLLLFAFNLFFSFVFIFAQSKIFLRLVLRSWIASILECYYWGGARSSSCSNLTNCLWISASLHSMFLFLLLQSSGRQYCKIAFPVHESYGWSFFLSRGVIEMLDGMNFSEHQKVLQNGRKASHVLVFSFFCEAWNGQRSCTTLLSIVASWLP